MTKFEPYTEYKDSGVEWLGQIPIEWDAHRIKMSVQSARNGIWGQDPQDGSPSVWCVRVADFDRKSHTVGSATRTMRSITSDELVPRRLSRGDLLLEKSGGGENNPVGFVVRFDYDDVAVCSNFVAKMQLLPGMDSRFWTYVHATTYSVRLTQRSIKQTSGIQNLDQASYFNEVAPFPPPKTQAQIADFLDRETAQIDDLIGKQERLIELLAEKRQAVITQAVTKGLDPESPTKPSRIPWLGDVNAEWPIRPLKAVGEINLGKMIQPMPKATGDVQAPYLRAANVQPGGVLTIDDVKEMWFTKRELSSLDVLAGDVVVVEGGIGGFGRAAFVDNDLAGFGYQNSINRIRPNQDVDGRFLTYLLLTARQSGFIHAYCTGVSMPHLTAEKLAVIQVPFPDYATQTAIGDFLDQRLKSFAQLSSKASNVISILQERRSALISAAVTGKINVLSKEL